MAAPVIEATATTTTTGGSGAAAQLDATIPSGTVSGELLLAIVSNDENNSNDPSVNTPSGWTYLDRTGDGTSDIRLLYYAKVSDGTEGGGTVTFDSVLDPSEDFCGAIMRISGWSGTIGDIITGTGTISTGNVAAVALTTTEDDSLVIAGWAGDGGDLGHTSVSGTGWPASVPGAQDLISTTGGNAASLAWVTKDLATAGSSSDCTFNVDRTDGVCTMQIAIPPAAGGPATVERTGSLSGTGTLTGAGTGYSIESATGSVSGTGSLSGSGYSVRSETGSVSGTASLAGVGSQADPPSASGTVSGTGTLTGAGENASGAIERTGSLSGAGTLTGSGTRIVAETGSVSGTGTLTGAGYGVRGETGSVSGTGTLTGTGENVAATEGTGSLAGTGTLTASGTRIVAKTASVSGSGLLAGSGINQPLLERSGSLSGSSTLTGTFSRISFRTGSIAGSATITGFIPPVAVAADREYIILTGLDAAERRNSFSLAFKSARWG